MIQNPILPGFNPDPSICRVGHDYYIATPTSDWFPGVQIHHSRDLANWQLGNRPLDPQGAAQRSEAGLGDLAHQLAAVGCQLQHQLLSVEGKLARIGRIVQRQTRAKAHGLAHGPGSRYSGN